MGTFKVIHKEIKEQILRRIKADGVSVSQAANDHAVSTKTIYNWLNRRLDHNPSYRDYARLKKQNSDLLTLVGQLTMEVN